VDAAQSLITGKTHGLKDVARQTPLILHVFDGFRAGGTELRTCAIINHLEQRFRHVVISNNGNFDASNHVSSSIKIQYIHPKEIDRGSSFVKMTKIRKIIRNFKPDLMITYEWGAIDWVLAGLSLRSVPILMTVEGFEESELFTQNKRRRLIRRLLYPRCAHVVVCSKLLYHIAKKEWRVPGQRLAYIPNGVDCARFRPSDPADRGNGKVRLGIVASLIRLKNHIKLFRCLKEMPEKFDWTLFVAGAGPELNNLKQACADFGLQNQVHFLGHVQDTPSFLRGLDIFCLSSETEQMPMVILEAMATGLPIISTDVGDIKTMVSEKNASFIIPLNDDAEYTRALLELISKESLRLEIGKANRRKCVKEYNQELMFTRYQELYTSLLSNPRMPE